MNKNYELLKKEFEFPFPPHNFQLDALNELSFRDCALLTDEVGYGKTFTSTLGALLYSLEDGVEQIWVVCPPILLDQWYQFLTSIKGIPDVLLYRGTPEERDAMDMDVSVILVSFNIFRGSKPKKRKKGEPPPKRPGDKDYKKFKKLAMNNKVCIIADELSLKSLSSQTYRKIKEIMYRKMRITSEDKPYHKLIALNATPLSDLEHVYNWCSLFSPGLYGSKKLFEHLHVKKKDHWDNVIEWEHEDIMRKNMELFSIKTKKKIKLPPLIVTEVPYQLEKKHLKLYNEVKESELMNLPEDKIELALNSMFSTLQRLVLIPKEFGLNIRSPIMDFIEGYLDQMQPEDGVLIYSRHLLVSKMFAELIPDCVAIYGGVPQKVREQGFEDIKSGKCKRLVGNMDSLGVGLNLQDLNHVIYGEFPFRDDKLKQSTGRVHRQGQKKTCFSSYPMAIGTIQYQIYHKLLKNGEQLEKVLHTKEQVREFLC